MTRESYVAHLEGEARRYTRILEGLLGPRDPRFVFGSIKKSTDEDDVPHTNFPQAFHFNGGCVVDIHISDWPWRHHLIDQGLWQIAHECVHLLDPGVSGSANVLEEGIATWFQDEPRYHIDVVKKYIERNPSHSSPYAAAKRLVCRYMPQLASAVKDIRASGVRIRDISAVELAHHFAAEDGETIKRLCAKFVYGT